MRYDIDPKTLKKAAPRVLDPVLTPPVLTNTFVFEGKPSLTGEVSNKHVGASGKLECYSERLRPFASHNIVCHLKKTKVISVIQGSLLISYYTHIPEDSGSYNIERTDSLHVGSVVQLNPGDVYCLSTGNTGAVFSVVQECAYDDRLSIIQQSQAAGEESSRRYKSKAKEQLAELSPVGVIPTQQGITPESDWNLKPMSDSELAALD